MEFLVIIAVIAAIFWRIGLRRRVDAPEPELRAVGFVRDTHWGVLRPLARVEIKRLLRHPAFLFGLPLALFGMMAATSSEWLLAGASGGIALGLVLLGWMTIVAGDLAALRSRRAGAAELMAALPAPAPVRTSAGLVAAIGPASVAVVLAVLWTALIVQGGWRAGSVAPLETAAGVLIVLGAGVLGVAVANWLPHPGFSAVAVIAVILIQARFLDPRTWPWNDGEASPVRFLAFLAQPTSDPSLEVRHAGWHVAYLLGLTVLMAGVALGRHGRHRAVAGLVIGGLALAGVAGWVQTRPPSAARVDAMVSYLTSPEAHQVCDDSGSARLCAYPTFAGWLPAWRTRVDALLALAPASVVARPLVVRQRVPTLIGDSNCAVTAYENALLPQVRSRVSPETLWPADGDVHPSIMPDNLPCSDSTSSELGGLGGLYLAVQTGSWAVGLPPAPHGRDVRCTADGQARAVAALWMGAAATPKGAERLGLVAAQAGGGEHMDFSDWDSPPMWGVRWRMADVGAAQLLLAMPVVQVKAVLDAHWSEITDPRTPSSRLLELAGAAAPLDGALRAPAPGGGPQPCA